MRKVKFILTCEHGGNEVPEEYEYVFNKDLDVLQSHRGYDIGALQLFNAMKEVRADASFFSTNTRLLIELNRSRHHKSLFSQFTKPLPKIVKKHILNKYYTPYRNTAYSRIYKWIEQGNTVVHISVHTFTPVLDGEVRNVDIGLLFDPRRKPEKKFCAAWKKEMKAQAGSYKIKYNKPYLGKSDGFTTFLRKELEGPNYLGIELEVNQKFFLDNKRSWPEDLLDVLTRSYTAMVVLVT